MKTAALTRMSGEGQTAACLSHRSGGMSTQNQPYKDSSQKKDIWRFFIQPQRITITQDAWLQNEEPIKRHAARFRERKAALPVKQNFKRKAPAGEQTQAVGQIRIKTLEEIRQEKAARSEGRGPAHEDGTRGTTVQLQRKRKLARGGVEEVKGMSKVPRQWEVPAKKAAIQPSEIRVKTLEEILREKAARTQAKAQEVKAEETPPPPSAPPSAPQVRRILRIKRNTDTGERSRHSTATPHASSSAPLDELDELMNEFAGNPMDREMELDPLMGLDDYIVELMATINNS